MSRRKRNRQFGGDAKRESWSLTQGVRSAAMAREYAQSGTCDKALKALVSSAEDIAVAKADASPDQYKRARDAGADDAFDSAYKAVLSSCVRRKRN